LLLLLLVHVSRTELRTDGPCTEMGATGGGRSPGEQRPDPEHRLRAAGALPGTAARKEMKHQTSGRRDDEPDGAHSRVLGNPSA
jgi:hypothetical protein